MKIACAWVAYAMTVCLLWGCGDQSGLDTLSTGSLELTGQFRFSKTRPGQKQSRTVSVTNHGKEPVILAHFGHEVGPEISVSWRLIGQNGKVIDREGSGLPPTIELDTGDTLRVSLTFTPTSPRSPQGRLFFRTNSGLDSQRSVSLPISGLNAIGELHISQNPVHFGRVIAGDTIGKTLTLTNFGTHTVRLDKLAIHGSAHFSLRVAGVDPRRHAAVLRDPDGDGVPGLRPDGQVELKVLFSPENQRTETGELHISSDANTPKMVVSLLGNAAAPCVYVSPSNIEFPPTAVGAERVAMVRIESCGAEAVTIESLSLTAGTDAYRI